MQMSEYISKQLVNIQQLNSAMAEGINETYVFKAEITSILLSNSLYTFTRDGCVKLRPFFSRKFTLLCNIFEKTEP
jgi:hypothetical protein